MEADIIKHSEKEKAEELGRGVLEGKLSEEKTGEKPREHVEELRAGGGHVRSAVEDKYAHRAHLNQEEVQDTGGTKLDSRQLCIGEIENQRRAGHADAGGHNAGKKTGDESISRPLGKVQTTKMAKEKKAEQNQADKNLEMVGGNELEELKANGLPAYSTGNHEEYQIVLSGAPEHCSLDKIGNKPKINENLHCEFRIVENHQQRRSRQHQTEAGDRLKKRGQKNRTHGTEAILKGQEKASKINIHMIILSGSFRLVYFTTFL